MLEEVLRNYVIGSETNDGVEGSDVCVTIGNRLGITSYLFCSEISRSIGGSQFSTIEYEGSYNDTV